MQNHNTLALLLAATCVTPAFADENVNLGEAMVCNKTGFDFIPTVFIADAESGIYSEDDGTYTFFDEDFNELRSITPDFGKYSFRGESVERLENGKWVSMNNPEENEQAVTPISMEYSDYRWSADQEYIELTQTLFNDDLLYEFIVPEYKQTSEIVGESDENGDGIIDYRIKQYRNSIESLKIVNENGSTLATLTPPAGLSLGFYNSSLYISIRRNKNATFLIFEANNAEGKYVSVIYKINTKTSSVNFVKAVEHGMTVRPTMQRRSEPVTVSLDEAAGFTTLQVVDSAGMTVLSMPVENRSAVELATDSLRRGMYIVRASDSNGKQQETCKIIIR